MARDMTTVKRIRQEVSPALAAAFLAKMPANRHLYKQKVEQYARAMTQGDWMSDEGTPLRFDTAGNLIDGQHRLHAVIVSGKTIWFDLICGLDPAVMGTFDVGRTRTLGDFLQIKGETDALYLAGTIRYLLSYDATGVLTNRRGYEISVRDAMRYLDTHPDIRTSVKHGGTIQRHVRGGQSFWSAIDAILGRIDYDDAQDFLSRLASGEGLAKGDAILSLRKRIIDDAQSLRKMRDIERSAIVFKAWNLYREGTRMEVIQWRSGGARPEAYPAPL